MRGHLFDFQRDSFSSPRGKLRLRYHRKAYPKFPRYVNDDTALRHDLSAFKSGRLSPIPSTTDDVTVKIDQMKTRISEIIGCGMSFADALANFDDEISEMLTTVRELDQTADTANLRMNLVLMKSMQTIATDLSRDMKQAKRNLGDDYAR